MSGKIVRFVVSAVLALVVTLNATAVSVPTNAHAANSTATLAMELGTTGS